MSKKKKRIGRNLEGMIVETTTIERKMKNRLPHEKSLHPSYTIPPRCSDRFSSDSVLIFCLPFLRFLIMCYSPSRKNADWISISTIRENIYLHFSFRNKKFFRGEFLFCFLSILHIFFFFFFSKWKKLISILVYRGSARKRYTHHHHHHHHHVLTVGVVTWALIDNVTSGASHLTCLRGGRERYYEATSTKPLHWQAS